MTNDQKASYIHAASTRALIRALGMYSENIQRSHRGESMAYTEEDFENLIHREGIDENAVINWLRS